MKATLLGGAAASLLTISAFAADLRIPPAQPQVVIPPFTWTSCYAGVQAGGGWGKKDLTDSVGIFSGVTGYSSASVDVTRLHAGWTNRLRLSIRTHLGCGNRRCGNWWKYQ